MLNIKIKTHTKAPHQHLEKIVITKLKAIKNEADYANLLKYFYAYFNELEKAVAPLITDTILSDFAERRKAERLKADIQHLGEHIDRLPEVSIPLFTSSAQAMGALYVMEGSVMGGPIIISMLQKSGINRGFGFFSSYGDATPEMWAKFITALNTMIVTKEEEQLVLAAASQTFADFAAVFNVDSKQ